MTAFPLLIICVAVQILIAAGLRIFLLWRHLRRRKDDGRNPSSKQNPSDTQK